MRKTSSVVQSEKAEARAGANNACNFIAFSIRRGELHEIDENKGAKPEQDRSLRCSTKHNWFATRGHGHCLFYTTVLVENRAYNYRATVR